MRWTENCPTHRPIVVGDIWKDSSVPYGGHVRVLSIAGEGEETRVKVHGFDGEPHTHTVTLFRDRFTFAYTAEQNEALHGPR